MHGQSPFIDTAAVEAWDAWFRSRERGRLQDITVEETWRRTARVLATVESVRPAAEYEAALMMAFASWRLLLDERVMATACTSAAAWPNSDLVAVLNASMFVRERFSTRARFDLVAFGAMAELAVKALDSAAMLGSGPPPPTYRLRVGIVGLADALALLGMRYNSPAGCAHAARIGRALAEGCFRGAVRSSRECDACREPSSAMLELATKRGLPAELLDDARRHGLRHGSLTAITSQPRLALFANNVANALDPLSGEDCSHVITTSGQSRLVRSSGYALTVRRMQSANTTASQESIETNLPASASIAIRQAIQPWIDEPITYALPDMRAAIATADACEPTPKTDPVLLHRGGGG